MPVPPHACCPHISTSPLPGEKCLATLIVSTTPRHPQGHRDPLMREAFIGVFHASCNGPKPSPLKGYEKCHRVRIKEMQARRKCSC
jgi:hypothetical protein